MRSNFDDYENRYEELVERSIWFAGRRHEFYVRVKAIRLLALIRDHVGEPAAQRVLDVGCGAGITHRHLLGLKSLEGVDISASMIDRARRTNPSVRYEVADALTLPFGGDAFDVAFAIGLLHHVQVEARQACLQEVRRVLRPGGVAVIFEHNPLNPLTRFAVHRCEFDEDAVLLRRREVEHRMREAGFDTLEARYILIAPWIGPVTRGFERGLAHVPLGAQYYVAARA